MSSTSLEKAVSSGGGWNEALLCGLLCSRPDSELPALRGWGKVYRVMEEPGREGRSDCRCELGLDRWRVYVTLSGQEMVEGMSPSVGVPLSLISRDKRAAAREGRAGLSGEQEM